MKLLILSSILMAGILSVCPLKTVNAQINYLNESKQDFDKHMQWFVDSRYGMFIHFGLYSQLGGEYKRKDIEGYAEWIQANADIPSEEYALLTQTWNPKKFDAKKIVRLAKEAGMKYLVVTTKHHEGFCLWDSPYTDFDIASTPMKGRDILKELADACKKEGIKFGTYYSIIDWHHSSQYRNPEGKKNADHWFYVAIRAEKKQEYIQYMKNQIKELIDKYDTDILWFDGDWVNWWDMESGQEMYQYIRNLKPSIIINNRVAKREEFYKDFGTPEQEHPATGLDYYWEACYTMNNSWGYKKSDNDWKTPKDIADKLHEINEKGGNLLLNIGPDGNGVVPAQSVIILKEAGKLLKLKR
ncbi:alpha-L-fucosidase [Sphingobacterium spiritivorum]|uniref:alpha-L-fucosidase n=1 Tax=Sphingobacterium spiritivorum TaxID=258 RepID=UPI003DA53A07